LIRGHGGCYLTGCRSPHTAAPWAPLLPVTTMPAPTRPAPRSPASLPAASSRRCCGFWLPWLAAPLWMLFPLIGCLLAAELRGIAPATNAERREGGRRRAAGPAGRAAGDGWRGGGGTLPRHEL